MAISTEDCKKFLVETYQKQGFDTKEKDWSRLRKFKAGSLVCREFEHQALGRIVIEETNGVLAVSGQTPTQKVIQASPKNQSSEFLKKRTFTKKSFKEAKSLVQRYALTKGVYKHTTLHDFTWASSWFAIPNLFSFHFESKSVVDDIDSIVKPGELILHLEADKKLDKDILGENKLFLPNCFSYQKNGIAVLNKQESLINIVKALLDKGFTYEYQKCNLSNVIPYKQIAIVEDKIGLDLDKNVSLRDELIHTLLTDDTIRYETLLSTKIPFYGRVGRYSNLRYCVEHSAYKCLDKLLDMGYSTILPECSYTLEAGLSSALRGIYSHKMKAERPDLVKRLKDQLFSFDFSKEPDVYPYVQGLLKGYLTCNSQKVAPQIVDTTETELFEHIKNSLSGENQARFVTDCGLYLSCENDLNTYEYYMKRLSNNDVLELVSKYNTYEYDPYRTPLYLGAIKEMMLRSLNPDDLSKTSNPYHSKQAVTSVRRQVERYYQNIKFSKTISDNDKQKIANLMDVLITSDDYINHKLPSAYPSP